MNFSPRAGFTWSPLKSGRMSVRGSWGLFYDWFPMGTYAQVLQTDGTRQRDINILNPTFPDPGPLPAVDAREPVSARRPPQHAADESHERRHLRLNQAAVDGRDLRIQQELEHAGRPQSERAGERRPAGPELREHHTCGWTCRIQDALGQRQPEHESCAGRRAGGMPNAERPASSQPFFSLRRNMFVSMYFGATRARNNSDGSFAVPASGSLEGEWGPAAFGGPWNVSANFSSGMIKNLNFNWSFNANAGPYYTITTGIDDNRDAILNDRPAGVGRNTERGAASINSYMSLNYTIGFGKQASSGGGPMGPMMIMERGGAVAVQMGPGGAPSAPRYRLNFGVFIDNPTNHANYGSYSGVMTSEFFKQPTSAYGVRRIRFRMGLRF